MLEKTEKEPGKEPTKTRKNLTLDAAQLKEVARIKSTEDYSLSSFVDDLIGDYVFRQDNNPDHQVIVLQVSDDTLKVYDRSLDLGVTDGSIEVPFKELLKVLCKQQIDKL